MFVYTKKEDEDILSRKELRESKGGPIAILIDNERTVCDVETYCSSPTCTRLLTIPVESISRALTYPLSEFAIACPSCNTRIYESLIVYNLN
jgi:hypothetical protein